MVLLRAQPRRLVVIGLIIALVEQAILFRRAGRRTSTARSCLTPAGSACGGARGRRRGHGGPGHRGAGRPGGLAGSRALLGPTAPSPAQRTGPLAVALAGVALLCAASASAFLLVLVPLQVAGIALGLMITVILWVPTYGLLGLVAPAVVIDGLGLARALRRSVWLAARNGMRAALIRVLGYASWLWSVALTVAATTSSSWCTCRHRPLWTTSSRPCAGSW